MSRTSRKARRIVAAVAMVPRQRIQPDMRLDDLGLDMLDRMEIVVAAESATGGPVQGENDWQTVGDVIASCRAAVIYGDCQHGAAT